MRTWKHTGIILLISIIILSNGLKAQHKPFQFGFKGGVNIGWLKSDNDKLENEGSNFGGSWGFVADVFIMENYSFTTGFDVLYINGDFNTPGLTMVEEGDTISGTAYLKVKSQYIQVPIIFTMKTNNIKEKFRIYGQVGYGLGFRFRARQDYRFVATDGKTIDENKGNDYDGFTFTRSSLILGVGAEIPLHKSTYLRSGFTFDNCFVDISKSDQLKVRSNFIAFSVAVIF
jgi:hypothetical protein